VDLGSEVFGFSDDDAGLNVGAGEVGVGFVICPNEGGFGVDIFADNLGVFEQEDTFELVSWLEKGLSVVVEGDSPFEFHLDEAPSEGEDSPSAEG
jgi:hypothetical protein